MSPPPPPSFFYLNYYSFKSTNFFNLFSLHATNTVSEHTELFLLFLVARSFVISLSFIYIQVGGKFSPCLPCNLSAPDYATVFVSVPRNTYTYIPNGISPRTKNNVPVISSRPPLLSLSFTPHGHRHHVCVPRAHVNFADRSLIKLRVAT